MATISTVKNDDGRFAVRHEYLNMSGREFYIHVDEIKRSNDARVKWLINNTDPTFSEQNYGIFSVFVSEFTLEEHQFAEYLLTFG